MNVPLEDLNAWRTFAERVRSNMFALRDRLHERKVADALALAEFTMKAAILVGNDLERAGAEPMEELAPPPEVALDLLDTTANRAYLEALRDAYAAAQRVDEERGWGGHGPAEILDMLIREVEQEVYGPPE